MKSLFYTLTVAACGLGLTSVQGAEVRRSVSLPEVSLEHLSETSSDNDIRSDSAAVSIEVQNVSEEESANSISSTMSEYSEDESSDDHVTPHSYSEDSEDEERLPSTAMLDE